MGKYENILKMLDEAIARKDSDLKFYKEQYHKATDDIADISKICDEYREENTKLKEKIKKLESDLDFYLPKNCKGEQAK
ncbi:MAG: hypothetical protein IKU66_05415 [Clostridia bacterium]|nr:hypothetical protein [Clostridia bacterium]